MNGQKEKVDRKDVGGPEHIKKGTKAQRRRSTKAQRHRGRRRNEIEVPRDEGIKIDERPKVIQGTERQRGRSTKQKRNIKAREIGGQANGNIQKVTPVEQVLFEK